MANTFNALTTGTGGVATSGDSSGTFAFASNGTTVATISATGVINASAVTGLTTALTVAQGGTGATTLTSGSVLVGAGTSAISSVAPGTSGNLLTSNGTAWVSSTPAGGGVTSLNGQTGAITNTSYGSIGSYVIAAEDTYTGSLERLPDVTVAGSTLVRSTQSPAAIAGFNSSASGTTNTNGVISGATTSLGLSGTWRRLTRSYNGTSGASSALNLYVRTV